MQHTGLEEGHTGHTLILPSPLSPRLMRLVVQCSSQWFYTAPAFLWAEHRPSTSRWSQVKWPHCFLLSLPKLWVPPKEGRECQGSWGSWARFGLVSLGTGNPTSSRLCRWKSRNTPQLKSHIFHLFPLISARHQMSRTSFLYQKPSRVEFSISQRPSSHVALCSFLLWPCAFSKRHDRKHYEEQGMPFHRMTDAAVHPKEGWGTTESACDSQLSLSHSLNQGRAPTQPSQLLGLQPNERWNFLLVTRKESRRNSQVSRNEWNRNGST